MLKKKEKKGLFWPKKQAGAELKHKKGFFKQKIDQFWDFLGQKNKLGLSLRRKKFFFVPKIGENFENKVQEGPILKKKNDFSGQKNKLGLSLRRKKRIFWIQNWKKIWE